MNRKLSAIVMSVSVLAYLPLLSEAAPYGGVTNYGPNYGTNYGTDYGASGYQAPPQGPQAKSWSAQAKDDKSEDAQPSSDVNPWSSRATKRPITDQQITEILVKGSVASYTGECPCPYSTDKNGKKCGDNSEYIRAPGDLLCYPEDVTQRQIFEFRAKNRIPNPGQPWMIYR